MADSKTITLPPYMELPTLEEMGDIDVAETTVEVWNACINKIIALNKGAEFIVKDEQRDREPT